MRASVVDLRTKMKEVLQALRRNEQVEILYHGKVAGIITPPKTHAGKRVKVQDHPLFGMSRDAHKGKSVQQIMEDLRGGRYHDI